MLTWGCTNSLEPTKFDPTVYPLSPLDLKVTIGDGAIVLRWNHPKADEIDRYFIYRKIAADSGFVKIDSTITLSYTDSDVINGVSYQYGVSAMQGQFEGARTVSAVGIPTVFGLIINSGAEFTKSRSVVLALIAPLGTTFMKISNDSTFANAQWEPYLISKPWTLSEEDGVKTVYVHYRDAGENETNRPASDDITLDRKAVIGEVTQNTAGQIKSAGQFIHFTLTSGEIKGVAAVDIGTVRTNIILFDDGTNGDNTRDNGVYERDFQIPTGLEVTDATVTGHFTDQLGNLAEAVEAMGRVTIQNPPMAVTLLPLESVNGSRTSLRVSWTTSPDQDFASYKLYRSLTANVTTSSMLVTSIESKSTISFVDPGLQENVTYFYRLYVFDSSGLSTASNEVSGTTAANLPPTAVTLFDPEPISGSTTSLRISWTQNNDPDFASYKLYRALTAGVSSNSTFVANIESRATLSFVDAGLEDNTLYYYRLYVVDSGGLKAESNEVNGLTPTNEAPTAVTLLNPEPLVGSNTSLRLSWTQNNDPDFASYKLYRSQAPGVSPSSTFVTSIDARSTLSFVDATLNENTLYYYRLYVFDSGGLSTESNEVSATTSANLPPAAVTLLEPLGSATSMNIFWTKNDDPDFASYKLFRSSSPGVSANSTFVISFSSSSTLSHVDNNLQENTTYFYKIFVFDTGGLSSGSNEVSGSTSVNEPPKAVDLAMPLPVNNNTALRLSWSLSTESDFHSYRVYRSDSSPVDTTQAAIAILNNIGATTYDDSSIDTGVDYFYRVAVFDKGGLSAGSNEVTGRLNP